MERTDKDTLNTIKADTKDALDEAKHRVEAGGEKVNRAVQGDDMPLGDRVVIKPTAREDMTKSGIVLPDTAKEKPQEGSVLAVGPGRILDDGKREPVDVKVGDMVKKNQSLGVAGATGMAGGVHVHFSMQIDGVQVNRTVGAIDLESNAFYREFIMAVPLTEQAKALPQMQGSGRARDLAEAVSLSPTLGISLASFGSATTRDAQRALWTT